jgi:pyruvate,water dikinase
MVAPIKGNNRGDKMRENSKIILRGIPASPGIAEGKVKILNSPDDSNKMDEGDILVAYMTNPQYTAAIMKAAAVVTEIGSRLSHPAIISREMGIPCVVNVKGATKILKDGMEVIVDGTNGYVLTKS